MDAETLACHVEEYIHVMESVTEDETDHITDAWRRLKWAIYYYRKQEERMVLGRQRMLNTLNGKVDLEIAKGLDAAGKVLKRVFEENKNDPARDSDQEPDPGR